MMTIDQLLAEARRLGASDVHLRPGMTPRLRLSGELTPLAEAREDVDDEWLAALTDAKERQRLTAGEDLDFAYQAADGTRHRVNIFRQQGQYCAAIRLLAKEIPSLDSLGLPPVLGELALRPRGLVLVTGPAGSGKSTTLAAMLDHINRHRRCHILTIEDPIEYCHTDRLSLISQRQLGRDVPDYQQALRSALREDPDVIMVGEMRDRETMRVVLTAAETGHLVLSTLHTTGAAKTVSRILDAFSAEDRQQIRGQLAGVLQGVASQLLLPKAQGGGRTAALEIMVATDAVSHLIRENQLHQLDSVIQTGSRLGMRTLDADLARLAAAGICTEQAASQRAVDQEAFRRLLRSVPAANHSPWR